ncbi:MAG: hypothetical protein AAGB12_13305 [Pseudomonadota bacterium]
MMNNKTLSLSVILWFFCANAAFAEVEEEPSIFDAVAYADLHYQKDQFEILSALLKAEEDFTSAHIAHQKELMRIAERAYTIQYWMTIGIYIIVTMLVFGGFYLSFLQFQADIKQKDAAVSPEAQNKATFKIGKTGVEFSSSVIGLVVLFMSFMFFYLYVKDVYPINVDKIQAVSFSNNASEAGKQVTK